MISAAEARKETAAAINANLDDEPTRMIRAKEARDPAPKTSETERFFADEARIRLEREIQYACSEGKSFIQAGFLVPFTVWDEMIALGYTLGWRPCMITVSWDPSYVPNIPFPRK